MQLSEYLHYLSKQTVRQYLRQFCNNIVEVYGTRYLTRSPAQAFLNDLEQTYEKRGFPAL